MVLVYIVFRLFFVGENVCKSRVLSTTHDSIIQPKTRDRQNIPSTSYNLFSLVMSLLSFFWSLRSVLLSPVYSATTMENFCKPSRIHFLLESFTKDYSKVDTPEGSLMCVLV